MTDKVVDLGAFRAKLRQRGPWLKSHCHHIRITVDRDAGVIECDDCGKSVSAFHLVVTWCERWSEIAAAVDRQKRRAAEIFKTIRAYRPRMRAIKELERRWWRGNMLPCCPHCRRGLMPEDIMDGTQSMVSREYEMARRAKEAS